MMATSIFTSPSCTACQRPPCDRKTPMPRILPVWLDPDRFAGFRVEFGELVWGDYELCFPMIDLYRNKIDHRNSLEAVA